MTFNVPLFGEVWSGTGLSVVSLFVVGGVFGLWSDSDSDVESSLLGFSTAGEASAFVLRMDGMSLWSAGISAMALATSSVPNFDLHGIDINPCVEVANWHQLLVIILNIHCVTGVREFTQG